MNAKYKYIFNRQNRLRTDGTALVQLRVYLRGIQKFFSTGIYLAPAQWDEKNGKVKNHSNQIRLNKQLRDKIATLEDHKIKLLEEGKTFSFEHIAQVLKGSSVIDFESFCREQLEQDRARKYSTYRAMNGKLNVIERFGKLKHFSDLTFENIYAFDNWLRDADRQPSTIFKYHSTLKYFIGQAIKRDLFNANNNPYLKFAPKRPKSAKRKYLDAAELQRIENKVFATERLNVVRDLFLFSVYTGMSYSDIADLNPKDIYTDREGYVWIWRDRVKTDSGYKVPLLPQAAAILERYGNVLPVRTNQRLNEYLKEIADLCGIYKELTFHMARHTFATTITLSNNVPIETVSKMLGHTDLKTTQIYAKIVDEKMKADMQELRKKLGDK